MSSGGTLSANHLSDAHVADLLSITANVEVRATVNAEIAF
jgi:hypothetical protein